MTPWTTPKSSPMRGLRDRSRQMAPCRYCGAPHILSGLHLHERSCQRTNLPPRDESRCECGEEKPSVYPTCWRCVARSADLVALDAYLRATGQMCGELWRGRVVE
ncbi:MAG TPA: hypothetical protein VJV74_11490 [Terriglobia bacterium]|nr:hypothetical protein [Terriglobia bacterium]